MKMNKKEKISYLEKRVAYLTDLIKRAYVYASEGTKDPSQWEPEDYQEALETLKEMKDAYYSEQAQ